MGTNYDEYGHVLTAQDMLDKITDRSWPAREPSFNYENNYAEPGPNNLARRCESAHTTHGDGTYDLVQGEFS